MRGDGQRPPHLAGALDAIAPAQAHSRRPCGRSAVGSRAGLLACRGPLPPSGVPPTPGALGRPAFQDREDGPGSP